MYETNLSPQIPTRTSISEAYEYNFQEKSSTGFVGLTNQGATGYLNSLIQTLYLTPEFKNALYNWIYSPENDGPEESNIPLQLQKLFGLLQGGQAAVQDVRNLTISFGWCITDTYKENVDVQELFRKLLEAMEIIFKNGNFLDKTVPPVRQLYEGTLKDYIRCDKGHERVRYDPFMDLLLSIKHVDSLHNALDLFMEEEILQFDDKWACDACGTRVNAVKGLRLKSVPLFLTLQLKRFDYDFMTFQRIKLNNYVSFPLELDIKKWLIEDTESKKTQYELFSVLIHQGGAQGGHHYALIKDISTNKWFKFNDTSVTEVEETEVEEVYGEKKREEKGQQQQQQQQSGNYTTNAYLLFYRRKGDPIPEERSMPSYIRNMVLQENEKYLKAKEEYIQQKDNLLVNIYFKDTILKLHINKNKTLKDAMLQVYTIAGLTGTHYTVDSIRLRDYNSETGTLGRVWKEYDKSLDQLGVTKNSNFKLEIIEQNDETESEDDVQSDEESEAIQIGFNKLGERDYDQEITINKKKSLSDLRKAISVELGCPTDKFQICKSSLGHQFKNEEITLEQHGLYDGQTVFVKWGSPLQADQVTINFSIYHRNHDTFTPLHNVHIISQDILIEHLRFLAFQEPELEEMKIENISYIRLRGQHGKKAGPILFDGNTLKKAIPNLSDHHTIAIQILDRPEYLQPGQMLIQIQCWHPSKQELQEKGDVILPEGSNILSLKKHIATVQKEIAEEYLAFTKPFSFQLKNKNTLSALLKWDLDPEVLLQDGDLILYKDNRDPEVEIEDSLQSHREGMKEESQKNM